MQKARRVRATASHSYARLELDFPRIRTALLNWYRLQNRLLPWREAFKKSGSPYPVWISEIMLQQTLISVVTPKFIEFMQRFPNVESLAAASEPELRQAVAGLGYYRRFANLHKAAVHLAASGGKWPKSAAEWRELPGIGPYTSAAIASITLGEAAAVLDGNVERVLCRILDIREAPAGSGVLKKHLQRCADELLDDTCPGDFNQAVMELGQLVCTKANPACRSCPFEAPCLARARGSQAFAPAVKDRGTQSEVRLALCIIEGDQGVALVRRPGTARFLKGTWGFPTFQLNEHVYRGDGHPGTLGAALELGVPFIRHNITNHKITAEVVRHRTPQPLSHYDEVKWVKRHEVVRELVANLDRKAWLKAGR